MEIAVVSETDSRMFIYPLIKCLYNYGTIAIYTTNAMMSRLIESELEGGFRNIRIIVDVTGDLESVKEVDEFNKNKYDFVIYDNIGATDYDLLINVVTNRITEKYVSDILYNIEDERTHIIKMGTPAAKPKPDKSSKSSSKKDKKPKKGEEEVVEETIEDDSAAAILTAEEEEVPDDLFNKWDIKKTESDILKEKLQGREAKWIKFPTWDSVEKMESRGVLIIPGDDFIKEMHRLFGSWVNVDLRMFTKGAKVNESSINFPGADVW